MITQIIKEGDQTKKKKKKGGKENYSLPKVMQARNLRKFKFKD